jgi:hypothetical protein
MSRQPTGEGARVGFERFQRICLVPEDRSLSPERRGDSVKLVLPRLSCHSAVVLEYWVNFGAAASEAKSLRGPLTLISRFPHRHWLDD